MYFVIMTIIILCSGKISRIKHTYYLVDVIFPANCKKALVLLGLHRSCNFVQQPLLFFQVSFCLSSTTRPSTIFNSLFFKFPTRLNLEIVFDFFQGQLYFTANVDIYIEPQSNRSGGRSAGQSCEEKSVDIFSANTSGQ